jgi:ubiquinone/menaquinone biosynthesis C-methylase UbiE
LVCGDAVRLPFADEAFDLVFAVSTIQHVTPRWIDTCIADIARVSRRYIGLIEFTEELPGNDTWFRQSHMFRHDYVSLMAPYANLRYRAATGLQIQPAMKEVFLFEKPRPA